MPNINQYIKQSWRLLRQNRLAALLSILGTALAICMIMVFVILFIANTAAFKPESHRADTYYVTYVKVEGKTDGRRIAMTGLGLPFIKECFYPLKSTEAVTAVVRDRWQKQTLLSMDGRNTVTASILETDTAFWHVYNFDFVAGSPFSKATFESGLHEAVISEKVARSVFGTEQAVGKELKINFLVYRVCGVVKDVSRFADKAWADVWIPYTAGTHLFSNLEGIGGSFECYMLLKKGHNREDLQQELLKRIDNFNAGLSDVQANILHQPLSHLEKWMGGENSEVSVGKVFLRFGTIAFIILLVPALNISGIILAWTRKRIPEFALRQAYGATRQRIMSQVLLENLLVTLIGGLLGFILSYVALACMGDWLMITSLGQEQLSLQMVNGWVFIAAFILCLLLNLLSAVFPAWKATRQQISEALNS